MALPNNVDYGTVEGQFLLAYADSNDVDLFPDGEPAKGSIFFTPSPRKLLNESSSPNPVTIVPQTVEVQLDAQGYIEGYSGERGVRLVATNDVDLQPEDWTWSVEFRLTDQQDVPVPLAPFSFELPAGDTIDLAVVTPKPDSNGTFYLVGPTGPSNVLNVGTVTTLDAGQNATVNITGSSPTQTINFGVPKGDAATIAVGSTATADPGDPATVTNSGDATNAVFDFEIPRGIAATLDVGTTTTVTPGTPASVTNSGTTAEAVFDFEIPQGEAATVDAGTTTTSAPGTNASVTNSGTTAEAVFDFTIPRGDKGEAATIQAGTTTTGTPGTNATVANSGDATNAVFDFTIPRGDKGDTGDAATISVGTVTSVDPLDPATITNVGTSGAAVFNFEIPRGETGSLENLSVTAPITYSSNTIGFDDTQIAQIDGGSA